MRKKILVTGGAGYIGSHTLIELLEQTDYEVISIDNFSNSSPKTYERIRNISDQRFTTIELDLCDKAALRDTFQELGEIAGIIHFAAFKSVPESTEKPLKYYRNNLNSLFNLSELAYEFGVRSFIFSSSCSVYGNIESLPVSEQTTLNQAESPYAYTKQVGEQFLEDFCLAHKDFNCISLRYFNPVGAHESGLIGEDPINPPTSLVPVITKTAMGIIPRMTVYGTDYPTRDGSCIRDYIHVSDVANAHIQALSCIFEGKMKKNHSIFNLGTGSGVSVLEAIQAFEEVSGLQLNYTLGPRRAGDVVSIYSDTSLSYAALQWKPKHNLRSMMASAWKWEQYLNENN
ncbi:MAG: UDP-glucose 4-epimerase GalE [Bacteroidetes bacterium]|nr:MAG: UDP-glucose 4-epimerase GalE [Bacteroidota bacterium]